MNPIWLNWCGYLLFVAPVLIWMSVRTRKHGAQVLHALPVYVLLIATYFLTMWQARWGYFFVLIFALALPELLVPIKSSAAVWIAFVLSMSPIFRDWDERLWPSESQLARRMEQRIESAQIRDLSLSLRSPEVHPFLAPWWLSPSIAYWSEQPGVTTGGKNTIAEPVPVHGFGIGPSKGKAKSAAKDMAHGFANLVAASRAAELHCPSDKGCPEMTSPEVANERRRN